MKKERINKFDVKRIKVLYRVESTDNLRVRILKEGSLKLGPVAYWMSRDQRVEDNWALLYAQELALKMKSPLYVIFCLVPKFLEATIRQYSFMIKGLQKVEDKLDKLNINFFILTGDPKEEIIKFVEENNVALLITDFDPLKIKIDWKEHIKNNSKIPIYEIDTHNIVPARVTSNKEEFGAYTIRPKILKLLPNFLTEIPKLKNHPYNYLSQKTNIDYEKLIKTLKINLNVPEIDWLKPGEDEALKVLKNFIERKLKTYHINRNDPSKENLSNLSPYLHFGQISAQRVAIEVIKAEAPDEAKNSFLEELIIRKELADNFCLYNKSYDSIDAAPRWARESLEKHKKDKREYIYDLEQFEKAKTHDELWNAAQLEMVKTGKMHSYMRMYWAKKILEWTRSPEEAFKIVIYLNDKYELDGRDPNGYAGIAWSILGIHDRAFFDRPIFGKIRYMSYNSITKKFNVKEYIAKTKQNF